MVESDDMKKFVLTKDKKVDIITNQIMEMLLKELSGQDTIDDALEEAE